MGRQTVGELRHYEDNCREWLPKLMGRQTVGELRRWICCISHDDSIDGSPNRW